MELAGYKICNIPDYPYVYFVVVLFKEMIVVQNKQMILMVGVVSSPGPVVELTEEKKLKSPFNIALLLFQSSSHMSLKVPRLIERICRYTLKKKRKERRGDIIRSDLGPWAELTRLKRSK